jgi:hypothetical protein
VSDDVGVLGMWSDFQINMLIYEKNRTKNQTSKGVRRCTVRISNLR